MKNLYLLFLSTLIGWNVQAQDTSMQWTPEFSMQFKSISDLDLSPDGKYVAYVVREPVMEGEQSEYLSQIWVAATDGSMNVQYTRGEKSSSSPAFSPDGQYIAFTSSRSEKNQVWVMRLMGGEPEQITNSETGVGSFQWSPDGKAIAYLAADPDTPEEEKAKKEKRHVIIVDQNFKYNHLYTVSVEKNADKEREVKRLTKGDFNVGSFDWSPDGKTIAFAFAPDTRINTNFVESDIAKVPSDSGEVVVLLEQPGNDGSPHYSPNGEYLAITSDGGKPEPIGLSDLYLIRSDGKGKPVALPPTPDRNANLLGWSADGKSLLFTESYRTSGTAMRLPITAALEGKKVDEVPVKLNPLEGTSSSQVFSSDGTTMAYVYQTPDQAAEVYIAKPDGRDAKVISTVNRNIELPKMGKTEVIQWTSKDGMEIEGLLTYPIDYEPGKKYPTVLQIHGGPAGVFTKSFTGGPSIYLTQYFAEKGFFVLRPNPRGSIGYGKEFRYANFKDWGYGDYEDLMSGVDHVIEKGFADEEKLVAMGWSYGGYMTSFLVTRTNRFKAASMGAGLPNLVSMVTTTDIPDYLVGHMGDEFWNDYETYEKHSAIYHIKNVQTPTQVIHGANDLRVPFTQGQEFYVALQRLGIPTEMIVLPRTPHGPSEPKLLMEVSPRIMRWFEKNMEIKP